MNQEKKQESDASTTDCLLRFLKETFKRDSFLPNQREIIEKMLDGRDCFAVLPTGGGKSLCYWFPAMYLKKCFVIITPLKALMFNQVSDLAQKFGITAYQYSTGVSDEQKDRVIRAMYKCCLEDVHLLYTTPESLATPMLSNAVSNMIRQSKFGGFVFDEAHTIVEYSSFRSEYATINVRKTFGASVPIAAFSASVTADMIRAIASQLMLRNLFFKRAPLNRPNITPYFSYCEAKERSRETIAFIRSREKLCGIVYCSTENMCKSVSMLLSKMFGDTFSLPYYGGESKEMNDNVRRDVYAKWMDGKVRCVVATTAFGMGINKEDVRYVIDYDPPKSPSECLQKMGRAGRDGEQSHYLAFMHYKLLFSLRMTFPSEECVQGIYGVQLLAGKEQGVKCCRPRILGPFAPEESVCCAEPYDRCTFCSMNDKQRAIAFKEAVDAVKRKQQSIARRKRAMGLPKK